jgi:hypothetical protein
MASAGKATARTHVTNAQENALMIRWVLFNLLFYRSTSSAAPEFSAFLFTAGLPASLSSGF